jgi:hypothetical protein
MGKVEKAQNDCGFPLPASLVQLVTHKFLRPLMHPQSPPTQLQDYSTHMVQIDWITSRQCL